MKVDFLHTLTLLILFFISGLAPAQAQSEQCLQKVSQWEDEVLLKRSDIRELKLSLSSAKTTRNRYLIVVIPTGLFAAFNAAMAGLAIQEPRYASLKFLARAVVSGAIAGFAYRLPQAAVDQLKQKLDTESKLLEEQLRQLKEERLACQSLMP